MMIDWSKWQYEPKNDEELTEIAQGIADGAIFTSDHVNKSDQARLPQIFIATELLGSPAFGAAMHREDIEMFYASLDAAGPWKAGEYPVFLACGFLNTGEAGRIRTTLLAVAEESARSREKARLENNEGEDDAEVSSDGE